MKHIIVVAALILSSQNGSAQEPGETFAPLVDHHQHLLSPSLAPAMSAEPVTADKLIAQLDAAGIRRALVLSLGYMQGSPRLRGADEYAKVKAENDWTAEQVAKYPDRLRAFCSVNPLRDYALSEIDRCAKDARLRNGLKLHLANARASLRKAKDVEQVRRVFSAANAHRMPIVVHLWTGPGYGAADAQSFLNEILPAAPDVPIQIAHLAGAGPGLDPGSQQALAVIADAVAAKDPRTHRLYFDVATIVTMRSSSEEVRFIEDRLRQIGLERILYGSDMAVGPNVPAREGWEAFRTKLPLREDEFRRIAANVAPYMR